jgi:hypothetical protein
MIRTMSYYVVDESEAQKRVDVRNMKTDSQGETLANKRYTEIQAFTTNPD